MIEVNPNDKLVFNLSMLQIDYNESKKAALRQQISDKYGVPLSNVEVNFVPKTENKEGEKISLTSDIIKDIQDPKFQQSLFEEYIKIKNIEDADIDGIIAIDEMVNSHVDFDAYSKLKSYKIKYLKWDNYLSYGEGNYFDFTKLKGLVLLNGNPENQAGKTTFAIDLLRFALFGKADKSPSLDSVFNKYLPEATDVIVEAGLEIGGQDYVIRRTVNRPSLVRRTTKSKSKQKVEYYKSINGAYELIENCEGETTAATNNIIRESIGNVEDFNLVVSATAYTLGDLLRLGQTDRGKLFSKWLGLVTIEEKDKVAKELYKKQIYPKLLSNQYDAASLKNEIQDMTVVIANNDKEISNLEKTRNEAIEKLDKLNNEKVDVISNKRTIKVEIVNLDVTTVENRLRAQRDELTIKRGLFEELKKEYQQVKDASFDQTKYDEELSNLTSYKTRIAELKVEIMHRKSEIEKVSNLISQGICPNCGQTVDVEKQNNSIRDIQTTIDKLINEGVELKKKLTLSEQLLAKLDSDRSNYQKLAQLKLKLTAVKAQIENNKLRIQELERQRADIDENKENIRYNNEIDNKLRLIEENIRAETAVKERTMQKAEQIRCESEYYRKEMRKRSDIIRKLTEEEKTIRNWSIYQELVGKNGIVKIVLKKALPIINNEIARLLSGLVDFKTEIVISDDGKVSMNLLRNGQILDLTYASSGYEGTMASLALRMALSSLGNMGKPNFLVLDEVLSGVAVSNHDNVKELYKRIINSYDFIMHICHESTVEDMHDQVITVSKKGNVSTIGNI